MVWQVTLNDAGDQIPKCWLTQQDLSFSLSQESCSVNNRIGIDQYAKMIYGWCLSQIIHSVITLQARLPSKQILVVSKYDYSDAYERIAHAESAAAE
jgi:hypothetical protein